MRYLDSVEFVLTLAACCFGAVRAAQEIRVAATESTPATFTAANFASRHRGEQWVRVLGRVAVEHRHVRPSRHEAHQGRSLAYVTVPVVAPDWAPRAKPVDVLATYGPMPQASVDGWSQQFGGGPRSVEGQLRPGGFRDIEGMFPRLKIGASYVTINEGTEPKHIATMLGFLLLMAVSAVLLYRRIRATLASRP